MIIELNDQIYIDNLPPLHVVLDNLWSNRKCMNKYAEVVAKIAAKIFNINEHGKRKAININKRPKE